MRRQPITGGTDRAVVRRGGRGSGIQGGLPGDRGAVHSAGERRKRGGGRTGRPIRYRCIAGCRTRRRCGESERGRRAGRIVSCTGGARRGWRAKLTVRLWRTARMVSPRLAAAADEDVYEAVLERAMQALDSSAAYATMLEARRNRQRRDGYGVGVRIAWGTDDHRGYRPKSGRTVRAAPRRRIVVNRWTSSGRAFHRGDH
jgi:hypothetical protein